MSNPDSTLLLVGLKSTGKTNFLVGLDVVLDSQTDPNGLTHSDLAADRAYLQPLKEQWLRGEVFIRTSRQQPPPPHQLLVRHPATGSNIGFHVPDLAGETFDAHFVTRSVPQDFCERLKRAKGLLLFVHCDHNADHALLEHPGLMDPALTPEAPIPAPEAPSDWHPEAACLQVKLVDLLQFIAETIHPSGPMRVAVMVSAWDLVEKAHSQNRPAAREMPNNPNKFLSKRWPLLDQYLHSHAATFESHAFGVSARGGGDSPAEITRLTHFDHPAERVILVDGTHRSHDLSRPVRWLLGLADHPTPPNA
jgi:hypothetical protein